MTTSIKRICKKDPKPHASLEREVNWYPEEEPFYPKKTKNSSLRIALICGDRLYRGLQYEGTILTLTEDNWTYNLKYGKPDFVLIEPCLETATGDWRMELTEHGLTDSQLPSLIEAAKQLGIPTVCWFTSDYEYIELYFSTIELFDYVFCADDRAISVLKGQGLMAELLYPAVQPAIYNRIAEYRNNSIEQISSVCDGLVDIIGTWKDLKPFCLEMVKMGGVFFDSVNDIWQSKIQNIDLPLDNILGTLGFEARLSLLKQANTYCSLNNSQTSRTARQWQAVEAAACRVPVLCKEDSDNNDFIASFAHCEKESDLFLLELMRHQKDNLYRERKAQKTWRSVVNNHCFSNRINTICKRLSINHDWFEYPSAALITPTYRLEHIARAKNNYDAMDYPNKEWVVVFNGNLSELERVKEQIHDAPNTSLIYIPRELHAGPCMNIGIQKAVSDYVFRMDDDDYYGPNYLLDTILHTRIVDYDISGKVFKYFVVKEQFPDAVFSRQPKMFDFSRPAICTMDKFPAFSFLCGASQGGRRDFMINNPYPNYNYGAVDTCWLDSMREKSDENVIALVLDDFNFVVDRRLDDSHTWKVDMSQILNNSSSEISKMTEVMV